MLRGVGSSEAKAAWGREGDAVAASRTTLKIDPREQAAFRDAVGRAKRGREKSGWEGEEGRQSPPDCVLRAGINCGPKDFHATSPHVCSNVCVKMGRQKNRTLLDQPGDPATGICPMEMLGPHLSTLPPLAWCCLGDQLR